MFIEHNIIDISLFSHIVLYILWSTQRRNHALVTRLGIYVTFVNLLIQYTKVLDILLNCQSFFWALVLQQYSIWTCIRADYYMHVHVRTGTPPIVAGVVYFVIQQIQLSTGNIVDLHIKPFLNVTVRIPHIKSSSITSCSHKVRWLQLCTYKPLTMN